MRHLPVDALLLFSVSSASSILPELHDRIRGLVGKVDQLVDLVDLHSGLVGGPGDQGPGDQDVKTGMGTCRGTGGSGVWRKQGGSLAQDRKYGPQTSRCLMMVVRTTELEEYYCDPPLFVAGLPYLPSQAQIRFITSAPLTSARDQNTFLAQTTHIKQICFQKRDTRKVLITILIG